MAAKNLKRNVGKTYWANYAAYEKEKAQIPHYITPQEYEDRVRKLADKYKI